MRPSRRAVLATLGASVVGAGCLGFETGQQSDSDRRESPETATESPTDGFSWSPTATEEPVFGSVGDTLGDGDRRASLDRVAVRDSLSGLTSADSAGIFTRAGYRYLLVEATVSPDFRKSAPEFTLVADGDIVGVGKTDVDYYGDSRLGRSPYASHDGGGWFAFLVPAPLDAADLTIHGANYRWTVPERVVSPLRRPAASFELREFTMPTAVEPQESFIATISVENTGTHAATFRGVLNQNGPGYYILKRFALELESGETEMLNIVLPVDGYGIGSVGDTAQFQLSTTVGEFERDVRITERHRTATD
jgi:hypothetical protein